MFDGLLKPKFYSKCKTAIKLTKTRMENITKKRSAIEKYLKKDIVDLLKNGLDYNAYGRAEGLLCEQNMSRCYALIDQFCGSILSNLTAMQRENECPGECRESVPSLMFAAARFADLPELRDLRSLFSGRYGNSLENFVNKEFVGRLKEGSPSKEMKVQLLRDIAAEFSVPWDSKQLDQKLFTPAVQPPCRESAEKSENDLNTRHRSERMHFVPDETKGVESKVPYEEPKKNQRASVFYQQEETNDVAVKLDNSSRKEKEERPRDVKSQVRRPSYRNIPPPYTKIAPVKESRAPDKNQEHEPAHETKLKPKSMRQRRLKLLLVREAETSRSTADSPKEIDEEEKVIDGLLMHYSKTKLSCYEPSSGLKGAFKPSPLQESNFSHDSMNSGENSCRKFEFGNQPTRASSLPSQSASSTDSDEAEKGHNRAISFQNDMFPGHVHPNLPDYDNLASRIEVLRGR